MVHLYSIRDIKTGTYGMLFQESCDQEAMRSVYQVAKNDRSKIGAYPEDFELYNFGTYEDRTGEIKLKDRPEIVQSVVVIIYNIDKRKAELVRWQKEMQDAEKPEIKKGEE